jgi:thiol-disulfide isomerase/thioredoxin
MKHIKQTALLLGIAVVAAATGAWLHSRSMDATGATTSSANSKLETLRKMQMPDLKGVRKSLSDWQGKILVVNFWAAWCDPCRDEIPEFVRLQNELAAQGVQFIGIAIEPPDRLKQVLAFVGEMRVNYPNLLGDYDAMALAQEAGNPTGALPFTMVMDRQGRLADAHLGRLNETKLRSMIKKSL